MTIMRLKVELCWARMKKTTLLLLNGYFGFAFSLGGFDSWHLLRVFKKDISLFKYDSSLGYQKSTCEFAEILFDFHVGSILCFPSEVPK